MNFTEECRLAAEKFEKSEELKREEAEKKKRADWLASNEGKAVHAAMDEWKTFWESEEGLAAQRLLISIGKLVLAEGYDEDRKPWIGIVENSGLSDKSYGLKVLRYVNSMSSLKDQASDFETTIQWFFSEKIRPDFFLAHAKNEIIRHARKINQS